MERIGSHGLSGTNKCVLCPKGWKETFSHIVFGCNGYEDVFKDLFNFIHKYTTRSYRNKLKSTDEASKINVLIRSQPDFTLAYCDGVELRDMEK